MTNSNNIISLKLTKGGIYRLGGHTPFPSSSHSWKTDDDMIYNLELFEIEKCEKYIIPEEQENSEMGWCKYKEKLVNGDGNNAGMTRNCRSFGSHHEKLRNDNYMYLGSALVAGIRSTSNRPNSCNRHAR